MRNCEASLLTLLFCTEEIRNFSIKRYFHQDFSQVKFDFYPRVHENIFHPLVSENVARNALYTRNTLSHSHVFHISHCEKHDTQFVAKCVCTKLTIFQAMNKKRQCQVGLSVLHIELLSHEKNMSTLSKRKFLGVQLSFYSTFHKT